MPDFDTIYHEHAFHPVYGQRFADAVGMYQEGFLADGVCRDLDAAFARAVNTATRLLPVIKKYAEAAA